MADEEVTDLTEEEGSESGEAAGGKGKKAKAPKAPKPPKEPKAPKEPKEPKAPRVKKEGSGRSAVSIVLVMLVIAVLLIGSIVAALYFNMFSSRAFLADFLKEPLLDFIVWMDPKFSAVEDKLRDEAIARQNQLEAWEERLNEREEEITELESRLETLETQLDRRKVELDIQEREVTAMYERTTPIYRRDMTPQELEDMISYATTFSRMSPNDAAEILYRIHTTQDVASILYYMSERNAAAIMAAFHPDFAAAVTNVWIYN